MRSPMFSYNHTETVARDCKSLNIKLIGGRRTAGPLVWQLQRMRGLLMSHLFLRRGLEQLAAVAHRWGIYIPPRPVMVKIEIGCGRVFGVDESVGGCDEVGAVGGEAALGSACREHFGVGLAGRRGT
jgi:hypothetical protein